MLLINLDNSPAQEFDIVLDGETYNFLIRYNSRQENGVWYLDISQDDVLLVGGVALLVGVNVLQQYDLPFNNLIIFDDSGQKTDPTLDSLGTLHLMVKIEDSEIGEDGSFIGT